MGLAGSGLGLGLGSGLGLGLELGLGSGFRFVHDLSLVHGLVALLRVLLGRVHEEARADGLAHLVGVRTR